MEKVYLCLDVGGTEIKAAPISESGALLRPLQHFPARAGENRDVLLAHFAAIMKEITPENQEITGARLAFPGPFDYPRGICLLQGLAKYDALYGVNLRQELSRCLALPAEEIRFTNDASAFALGEMGFGQARDSEQALFICIGTGCGSAFGVNGALASPGTPGVPASGYVYDAPYRDGCIDDYLSRRGLMALTQEHLGVALDGKDLAQRAQQGDEPAKMCFLAFGQRVQEALLPFLEAFRPETVCFGGQITRSAGLFLGPMEAACRERGIRLYVTEETSLRTLQGLTRI